MNTCQNFPKSRVKTGLEVFLEKSLYKKFFGKKVGLLCNQASINTEFKPAFVIFKELFGKNFKVIFSPQHGLFSEKQANMIGSPDEVEPITQVKVHSLYGPRLEPEKEILDEVDVIFVDLQDVGCRVYTFIWTLYLLMKACEKQGKEVIILDRPNPIGKEVEGPLLEEKFFSFIGLYSLPLRHGLTIGETALLFQKNVFKNLEIKIIKMENYRKEYFFCDTGSVWIFPSPNVPTWKTTLFYPGMVLLEGTNLSEGRGTTLPFQLFGAPYLKKIYEKLENFQKKFANFGVFLRPVIFEPWFDKWKGKRCYGFQIHLKNFRKFKPVEFALYLLKEIKETCEEFEFLPPPYEFEEKLKPIEILIGNKEVLNWLINGEKFDLQNSLYYNLKNYLEDVKQVKLYPSDD
jgi:uncharacterized protein YbbC (DUF1343 family)